MEAKDTVMSDKQILKVSQITRDNLDVGDDGYLTTRCNVAKAQAEISFPKGKQVGFEIGIEQGKAEGIREVVEWIMSHSEWHYHELPKMQWLYEPTNDRYGVVGVLIPISKEDWQAKLKEWGIEQ